MPDFSALEYILNTIADHIPTLVSAILGILGALAVLFAVWIGFKLATAKDEKSRQDAKMQVLYTLIGIVVVGIIQAVLIVGLNAWDIEWGSGEGGITGMFGLIQNFI